MREIHRIRHKNYNYKRIIRKDWLIILVISCILIATASAFYKNTSSSCTCKTLSTTNIPVNSFDDAGSAVAFYLTQSFDMLSIMKESKCGKDVYSVEFGTETNKKQMLYVDDAGTVYSC